MIHKSPSAIWYQLCGGETIARLLDMASDETMTIHSSMQEDDYEDDIFDGFDHDQHPNPLNLSRLSVCTSSSMYGNDEDDDDDDVDVGDSGMRMFISRLSIESFDADEEFSDDKEGKELTGSLSDSDNELGCYSLPATPPRRRNRGGLLSHRQVMGVKEYASENEAQKGVLGKQDKSRNNARRRRRIVRDRWMLENKGSTSSCDNFDCNSKSKNSNYFSGESDQGGVNGGAGLMVITRPKGGSRSLCMDLDEVKACRDLGFELEHERMLEIPSHRSVSGSTLDTSSGGNSPIANWRISSPGDDPRDVKARLKVWAQAVAIASASPRQGN